MRCQACGEEYIKLHVCPKQKTAAAWEAALAHEPPGSGLRYYLGQAFAIAWSDDLAVQRAARDENSLPYGLAFWTLPTLVPVLMDAFVNGASRRTVVYGVVVGLLLSATLTLLYFCLCHVLARSMFGATGSFIAVVRPLMLGSVVWWVSVIPLAGPLIAALWSLSVCVDVLSEVDGIQRLQAMGISIGVGVVVMMALYYSVLLLVH